MGKISIINQSHGRKKTNKKNANSHFWANYFVGQLYKLEMNLTYHYLPVNHVYIINQERTLYKYVYMHISPRAPQMRKEVCPEGYIKDVCNHIRLS